MRNENGFGSIVCLDKTGKKRRKPWAVRITTGWNGNKQVRKYLGYYKTQADALIALAEYHKNGVNLDLSKMTFRDVYDEWVARKEKTVSESLIKQYKLPAKHLGNLLDMPIKDIKKPHLQKWLDGIDLKPRTKMSFRGTINQIFEYALSYDIIQKNYAKDLEISEKPEKTGSIFTTEEIEKIWKLKDDRFARYILILLYTGMRIGEMLALDADAIFLDKGYMIGGNKTEAGKNRIIPLHDKILPLVEQNLSPKYLCDNGRGGKYSHKGFELHFRRIMDEIGATHKIHDTRKTAVSIMHSSGMPMETVRMIVGHSGRGVTESVYLYKEAHELVEAINMVEIPY